MSQVTLKIVYGQNIIIFDFYFFGDFKWLFYEHVSLYDKIKLKILM